MANTPTEQLTAILRNEDNRLLGSVPFPRRFALLELIRAIDTLFLHLVQFPRGPVDADEPSGYRDLPTVLSHGGARALWLFSDLSVEEAGAPRLQSTKWTQAWADSVIEYCSRVSQGQRILDMCRFGLGSLEISAERVLRFSFTDSEVGIEALESEEFEWLSGMITAIDAPRIQAMNESRPEFLQQMSSLVAPWMEHYIQYETNPAIDAFYEEAGILWSRQNRWTDAVPADAVIGGLPFGLYQAAVTIFHGWALKHMDFVQALLKKNGTSDFRNIITIWGEPAKHAEYLAAALNIKLEDAALIIDVLTLRASDISTHLFEPQSALPAFVKIGDGYFVLSIAGQLIGGEDSMTRELKLRFGADWDRAVNGRESVFLNDLYGLFHSPRFFNLDRQVKIKSQGALITDIDAVVYDQETGTLALFQLKWQDSFGGSMSRRNSKMKNLTGEGNQWVERMTDWIGERSLNRLPAALGLEKELTTAIRDVRLFVIGRNFSRFSGPIAITDSASWGTWPQVVRLLNEFGRSGDPLQSLHDALHLGSPVHREVESPAELRFEIGQWAVVIVPPAAEQSGNT